METEYHWKLLAISLHNFQCFTNTAASWSAIKTVGRSKRGLGHSRRAVQMRSLDRGMETDAYWKIAKKLNLYIQG
jgi:hypothetical protein